MQVEIAQLVQIRARLRGNSAALALVDRCLEFCFRSQVANDDPKRRLSEGEVHAFLGCMVRLRHERALMRDEAVGQVPPPPAS
ncbi:hypothetical protein [Phenylobacterium sp.]|jgi:hypothetical protein|uniref:hypothetical protein n=1 Tax=Phenylobacterium sp. TaxID=1871053 RepID=UPI002F94AE16